MLRAEGPELNPIELTRSLVRMATVNPPGHERECARYVGSILESNGFSVRYDEFADRRTSLVARIGGKPDALTLCMTGHLDTVPLGAARWSADPFAGDIGDGRIYGRGSSDMKGGVAAMIVAASHMARVLEKGPGLELVLTAGEETGCMGSKSLAAHADILGRAGAIVVGEPTANYPLVGHKGSIKLHVHTEGITAHGAAPEQGVNAIYKAARAVSTLERFGFGGIAHPVMGMPTINVGTICGGLNVNSVPDSAKIGVDIRTVPGIDHATLLAEIEKALGDDVEITSYQDEIPVWTSPEDAWVQAVFEIVTPFLGERPEARTASFFTDAGSLRRAYGHPPTVIVGPGEPRMAHQIDEYCEIERIHEAVEIYTKILRNWNGV
jgi:succinyl-diaminopimelate desuccinylase